MSFKEYLDLVKKNWKPLLLGAVVGIIAYCAGIGVYDKMKYLCTPKEKIEADSIDLRALKNPRFEDLNKNGKLESIMDYEGVPFTFEKKMDFNNKLKIEGAQYTIEIKK